MSETQLIEDFLLNRLSVGNRLLMEARLLVNAGLNKKVKLQRQVHNMAVAYGRKTLKSEIKKVEQRLFSDPCHQNFRDKIATIFK